MEEKGGQREEEIGEIERLQTQVGELAGQHSVQEDCKAPMVRNPMEPTKGEVE